MDSNVLKQPPKCKYSKKEVYFRKVLKVLALYNLQGRYKENIKQSKRLSAILISIKYSNK